MVDSSFYTSLFEALNALRGEMNPSTAIYRVMKQLLIDHFRSSPFAHKDTAAVSFGPFGKLALPYRTMGMIDSVDLFGIDELLIFAFYVANKALYRSTLDVGANLGLHSILMARCDFDVTAFEPDPVHAKLLRSNIARNGVTTVTIEEVAISDKDGEHEFVRVVGNTTGSHLAGAKANTYGELDRFVVPLRSFAAVAVDADFAKIDAEGHEVVILRSVPRQIWSRLDVMVEVGTPENARSIFDLFTNSGVRMFAQKIGWAEVTSPDNVPTSHREGSLFITSRSRMPWGDT